MSTIEVFDIPQERKYWVVRSGEEAVYFQHFRKNSVIAIGHADGIDFDGIEGALTNEQKVLIQESHYSLLKSRDEKPSQIGNKNGQVKRFLHGINVGDILLTVNHNSIMAGRVTSDVYVSDSGIGYQVSVDKYSECDFRLRRDVVWSRRYSRDKLPFELETVLRNPSAVYEISEEKKVDILNHWLSPIHIKGERVCMSTRIEKEESISNRTITRYSSLLDELELLAEFLSIAGEDASMEGYESYKRSNVNDYEYELTAQHSFMSPGDNFIRLRADQRIKLKYYAIAFALLFGSTATFAEGDQDLSSSPEFQATLTSLVAQVSDRHDFPDIVSRLELELPRQNADVLRNPINADAATVISGEETQVLGDDEFPPNVVSDDTPL